MSNKQHTAIFAGSFDPPTLGHVNLIERGLRVFDKITIAVGNTISKTARLTVADRVELLNEIFEKNPKVEIEIFNGLLTQFAKSKGITTLLRGLRTNSDFEYEMQMAAANQFLAPEIETVFLMTEGRFSHISSTLIKEIAKCGGSLKDFVPAVVEKKLKEVL